MNDLYQGEAGRDLLKAALRNQQLFEHNEALIEEVVEQMELIHLSQGDILIGGGRGERDLFVIISGKLAVMAGSEEVARCSRGEYVGEMALIDSDLKRSATVMARDTTVVGRIDEPAFSALADRYPVLWRNLAKGMARRLAGDSAN